MLKKISPRFIIQFGVVITTASLALTHQKLGIEKAAPIDAYCPFGAVESFFTLLFKGEFLKRIYSSSFILVGIFILSSLFLGRIFCGYFCPLGALQEWSYFLRKKLGMKYDLEFPKAWDKYLRYVKYLILLAIVYFSFYLNDLIFRNYDPYSSLMHFGAELEEKIFGYTILALVLIATLFSKNIWCRYFCPLGAFFGVLKKISFFKIKRNQKTCIDCQVCNEHCPANLDVMSQEEIKDADCISCGKCLNHCPKNSLAYTILNKDVTQKKFLFLLILLVIAPLIIAPYTPFWKTKPESNIVNTKGEINTADIRGSNTLQYLIETTQIPLQELQTNLNLPKNIDLSLKLKDIGPKYNLKNSEGAILETEDFRKEVDAYLQKKTSHIPDCPFEKTDCEFPGDCGMYTDGNKDNICDHSQ